MAGILERREVVVSRVKISYLERSADGEAAGPGLLLLHGLLATADTFGDLIAGLPTDRRIVALDLLSAEPLDPNQQVDVTFAGLSRLVTGFAAAIGLAAPIVVGHSHGGVLTLQMLADAEIQLSGVALLCPAHPFEGYHAHVVQFYLTMFGHYLALVATFAPRILLSRAYTRVTGPGHRLTRAQFEPYLRVYRDRRKVRRILRLLASWETDMQALGAALDAKHPRVPALMMWGDKDPIVEMVTADALQARLADCDRVTIPGAGHLLAEEAPSECAKFLGEWLSRRGL